ncbi:aminotransferase class V-fold PLP-dependent enzyme [Syntrophomonas curvata]
MILRKNIKGIKVKVPARGKKRNYIYFDNAASTPALIPVLNELCDYLDWYSGVHRGTGYKSLLSSRIYDDSHDIIGRFVGADLARDTVIMVKNTSEAINKLSYRLQLDPADVVITTDMEHHSNDLPWRARARVEYAAIDNEGKLDTENLEQHLKSSYPRTKLLAVCGASNVTGHVNDVHRLAQMAHEYGCPILVDGAQLVPHQGFDMKPHNDAAHIDYLAFSGHKIYSPFGAGVLIGPQKTFAGGPPEHPGGGTVKLVTEDKIFWADPPDRDEAGSPNVIGTYTLARTLRYLNQLGMEKLGQYEQELTGYALSELQQVKGITIYGSKPRVGVISFNLAGIPHALLGAVLCFDAGMGVRTGCFCAQKYVRQLLGLAESEHYLELYDSGRMAKLPGMVRVSLAAYNTREEIDELVKWLKHIAANLYEYRRDYRFAASQGGYLPVDTNYAGELAASLQKYM